MGRVRKASSTKLLDPAAIRRALAAQAPDGRFDGTAERLLDKGSPLGSAGTAPLPPSHDKQLPHLPVDQE